MADIVESPVYTVYTFYTKWCIDNSCTHGHCPLGCEHPQPEDYAGNGYLICGRCYFYDKTITIIEPCVPETCPDA